MNRLQAPSPATLRTLFLHVMFMPLHIYVDADACPNVIKDILYRASERLSLPLTLVANKSLRVPRSLHIHSLVVPGGFDEADDESYAVYTRVI